MQQVARFLLSSLALSLSIVGCIPTGAEDAGPPSTSGPTIVGAAGGSVTGPGGIELEIPQGALAGDTEVEVAEVDDVALPSPPASTSLAGTAYAFLPHGVTFAAPVTIRLPVEEGATRVLRLQDEQDATFEDLAGLDIRDGVATYEVTTFSIHVGATDDDTAADAGVSEGDGGDAGGGDAKIVQVSAGAYNSCARYDTGAVQCWGSSSFGQSTVPASLGSVVEVSAGLYHNCALDNAGAVTCWGRDDDGESTVPPGLGTIVQLSASGHTCAVDEAGAVTCWGQNGDGQRTVPAGLGFIVQVSASPFHTCALDDVSVVTCWGYNQQGQTTVPPGLGTVVQVSAGAGHSCSLDDVGAVTCWGDDTYGQSTPPADLGTVVQVGAGSSHTCALDDTGAVTCWGDNDFFGQTTVPAALGTIVQLSAGAGHTCVLDDAGTVTCWGRNDAGQSDVP